MSDSKSPTPTLSNETYDKLKYIALIILPALGTLYFTLSQIWGLPFATEVVGTITAIDTFLGVALHLTKQPMVGELHITETDDKKLYDLQMHKDPNELDQMNQATFKVVKPTS